LKEKIKGGNEGKKGREEERLKRERERERERATAIALLELL
jgi:hypothetical protein